MTNSFDEMRATLKLDEKAEVWRPAWSESEASFVPEASTFLDESAVQRMCEVLHMSGECAQSLVGSTEMFRRNPHLHRLAWHLHRELMKADPNHMPDTQLWPAIPEEVSLTAAMFYAHVFLSAVPRVRELHALRGIDEAVTRDTLSDFEVWMRDYRARTGQWGFDNAGWFRSHFSGRLFKLGRLQFQPETFPFNACFFGNNRGAVIALAGSDCRFRNDGQFDGADGVTDPNAWVAELSRGRQYGGSPIGPDGRAFHRRIELDASDWTEMLRKGDPVLGVHIPASGPLDFDQCGESFRRAREFFPRHCPEWPFRAFTCTSWMLDPQLALYLPASSNLVRFLKQFYILPVPNASDKQIMERVFGGAGAAIQPHGRESSLQRAVREHVAKGGKWRSACGVIFPQGFLWGSQPIARNSVPV